MKSSDLKIHQAERLGDSSGRWLNYLGRLQRRCERLGFPPDDELYRSIRKAYDGAHELHVRAHYLSCKSGVGRAPAAGDQ